MAFERLRQQQATEEIAKQQREKAVADAARAAQLQKEQADRLSAQAEQQQQAALQVERDRIEVERQKALAFREKSGVVKKLKEFTTLVQGLTLHPEGEGHTPSSVVDRLQWDKRLVETKRLPDEDYRKPPYSSGDYYIYHPRIETFEEKYLTVETFPDGRISIQGDYPSFILLYFGFQRTRKTFKFEEWHDSNNMPTPSVFEEPILAAYNNPAIMRYSRREQTSTYVSYPVGSD